MRTSPMAGLSSGWEWASLDEVAEVRGGIQKQAKRRPVDNKFPFLRVANVLRGRLDLADVHEVELFDGELERYALQAGDLLVVEGNGSPDQIGRAAIWDGGIPNCVHQNHLIRVRPSSAILSSYLQYIWNSPLVSQELRKIAASTSGLYTLSVSKLSGIRLPLPPLAEQHRIVAALDDYLSRLDAGMASVRRTRRRLGLLAKQMILDAVPVPCPDHWECVSVGEAGSVDLGRQRHPDWHTGEHMRPYLRVANVFEDRIDLSDIMEMNFPPDVFERFRLVPGDILLNEGQSPEYLGRPAMYRGSPKEVAFTNSLLRFKAGPGIHPEWALLVFRRHMHAKRFVREVRITTNIAHLSATRFKSVEFPIPPLDEQMSIVAETKRRLEYVSRMSDASDRAVIQTQNLRQALLAEAFAGRLVPQDPNDEPASELLARIRAERAAAVPVKRQRAARGARTRKELPAPPTRVTGDNHERDNYEQGALPL